jgi:hypothetical protein
MRSTEPDTRMAMRADWSKPLASTTEIQMVTGLSCGPPSTMSPGPVGAERRREPGNV